jgi:L,D-transpeptidase ErfK/SrfK
VLTLSPLARRRVPLAAALPAFLYAACGTVRGLVVPGAGAPEPISRATVRVPAATELSTVIGREQRHEVQPGETLLDVARGADLGFEELQDANPGVDPWVPKAETRLVVPSRWILPRSSHRGIVINLAEMRLYLFPESSRPGDTVEIRTWPIGIGTDDRPSPVGKFKIKAKDENPTWIVPDSILKTMDPPRRVVPPGPDNPLGQYRLRLTYGLYEIHGTDSPWAIGRLTTHGCIRLYPEDVSELFGLVSVGTPGELVYQPVKVGEEGGRVLVEVHADVYGRVGNLERHALEELRRAGVIARVDRGLLRAAVMQRSGFPTDVTRAPAGPGAAPS